MILIQLSDEDDDEDYLGGAATQLRGTEETQSLRFTVCVCVCLTVSHTPHTSSGKISKSTHVISRL